MALSIIKGDIFTVNGDVMINPTNRKGEGKGAIGKLALKLGGEEMVRMCKNAAPLYNGNIVITPSFSLKNSKFVFHVSLPRFQRDWEYVEELKNCYDRVFDSLRKYNIRDIVIPLFVSSSKPSYSSLYQDVELCINSILDFLYDQKETINIKLVINNDMAYEIIEKEYGYLLPIFANKETYNEYSNHYKELDKRIEIDKGYYDEVISYENEMKCYDKSVMNILYECECCMKEPELIIDENTDIELRCLYQNSGVLKTHGDSIDILVEPYIKGIKKKMIYDAANIAKSTYYTIMNGEFKTEKKKIIALCFALPLPFKVVIKIFQTYDVSLDADKAEERILYNHFFARTIKSGEVYSVAAFDLYLKDHGHNYYFYG